MLCTVWHAVLVKTGSGKSRLSPVLHLESAHVASFPSSTKLPEEGSLRFALKLTNKMKVMTDIKEW